MDEQASSRKKQAWTYAFIMVSVVALVIVVVDLLLPSPEPELTTAPTTSAAEPDPNAPVDYDVVEEPVDLSAPIPGCDTVEQPSEPIYSAFTSFGEPSYDNPKFPWFNGPKATAMSNAVAEMLPYGAEIEWASPRQSLVFQPVTDYGDSGADFNGITTANGSVAAGESRGSVTVQVHQSSSPIPACVAGSLDERRILPDGTVVDVHDTWQEVNGVRTLSRSAHAYAADGSWIYANAYDSFGDSQQEHSGKVPLTIDDLVRIVSDPGLRISTPVPPGTPAPSEGCRVSFATDGPVATREQARNLDTVLATIDPGGEQLPPLQLKESSNDTLCTSIWNVEAATELEISIIGGQPLPTPERPVPGSGNEKSLRTLPDGAVVETERSYGSSSAVDAPGQSTVEIFHSVVVTRPQGTQISITSSATPPSEPLSIEALESIALTPGLEL